LPAGGGIIRVLDGGLAMPTAKEEIKNLVDAMPDDLTWDEVVYRLYVRKRVQRGVASLDQGKGIPHEQVMREMRTRLNGLSGRRRRART
jgi:hypothetical protein